MSQPSISLRENPSAPQAFQYPDELALAKVTRQLRQMPGLISLAEVTALRDELTAVAKGERFLLQLGECAETFSMLCQSYLDKQCRLIDLLSLTAIAHNKKPVTVLGRMAGQLAKPRTQLEETIEGRVYPAYRGDLNNGPTQDQRTLDPERLMKGYEYSAAVLNHIRLQYPTHQNEQLWTAQFDNLPMTESTQALKTYLPMISKAATASFYVSHEALNLHYESALFRQQDNHTYLSSTHSPWIGLRTLAPNSPHVQALSKVANPIGLKVGPSISPEDLVQIIGALNPDNHANKIMIITRLGTRTNTLLPQLIQTIGTHGLKVIWLCDPMHGNTRRTSSQIKTRRIGDITSELNNTAFIHQSLGSHLGGLHIETSPENVTECLDIDALESELEKNYRAIIDPRLNPQQATTLIANYQAAMQQQPSVTEALQAT